MTSYFTISDPYDDLEEDLDNLIALLKAPPRLEPPTRARRPGKGCGAGKERLATSLADSTPSIVPSVAEDTGRTVRVASPQALRPRLRSSLGTPLARRRLETCCRA